MKNVGVPLAPAAVPAFWSCVDLVLDLGIVPVLLELADVEADLARVLLDVGAGRARCCSRTSCRAASRPCPALARGRLERRRGVHGVLVERQRLVHPDQRHVLAVLVEHAFTVGSARLQNGHWKSLNSTIVTLVGLGAAAQVVRERRRPSSSRPRAPRRRRAPRPPPASACRRWPRGSRRAPLPCLAMSMASLARFGLRGQFGSFFRQPAILPMPQPHSQSRSLSACSAVTFCAVGQAGEADAGHRRQVG